MESLHDLRVERDAGRMPLRGKVLTIAAVVLAVVACKSAEAPVAPADPNGSSTAATPASTPPSRPEPEKESDLPPPAKAVPAADLAGDFSCGPWSTKDLQKTDTSLIGDHVRVRFFAGASPAGDASSGKIEVQKDGHTLFYGARETFQYGDDLFERRAAKAALFNGDAYEAMTITGRDGKTPIVTGVRKQVSDANGDMVAIAHGWFLDPNKDVVDVAVFVSKGAVTDVEKCRRFAQKLISTAELGPKRLEWGKNADVDTQVSYAKFSYRLPNDWSLASSMGIHDFARIHFRKRGLFPRGFAQLQMALDSHPGDWKSDGDPEGDKKGNLLGLAVTWHLTKDSSGGTPFYGAWTKSDAQVKNDHAVASIVAGSAAERDAAVTFAESVKAGR